MCDQLAGPTSFLFCYSWIPALAGMTRGSRQWRVSVGFRAGGRLLSRGLEGDVLSGVALWGGIGVSFGGAIGEDNFGGPRRPEQEAGEDKHRAPVAQV